MPSLSLSVITTIISQINLTRAAINRAATDESLQPVLRVARSVQELREMLGADSLTIPEGQNHFYATFPTHITNAVSEARRAIAGDGRSYRTGEAASLAFMVRLKAPLAQPEFKLPAMLSAIASRLPEETVEGYEPCPPLPVNPTNILALINQTRAHLVEDHGERRARPIGMLPLTREELARLVGADYIDHECPCCADTIPASFSYRDTAEVAASVWNANVISSDPGDFPSLREHVVYLPEELALFAAALPQALPPVAPRASMQTADHTSSTYTSDGRPFPARKHTCGAGGAFWGFCPHCQVWSPDSHDTTDPLAVIITF